MEIKGVKDIKFFAKGKRSKVYIGEYKKKKVIVKVSWNSKNEEKWLKKLNKYNIGPKLFISGDDYIVYGFVEGKRVLDYIAESDKKEVIRVLKEVFRQCRVLDKLKIDKKEMHNPWKHILISKDVKMIDFERCHSVERGKNVTQFGQFLIRKKDLLKRKEIIIKRNEMIKLLKNYKDKQIEANFRKIIHYFR